MRNHIRNEALTIKCTNCEYEATNENLYPNHMVDNHSTIHICQTCNNRFPTKMELINHAEREHGSIYTNSTQPPRQNQGSSTIKCSDCETSLDTKEALMKHKSEKHWKQKKCTFYWGVGASCRFPDSK